MTVRDLYPISLRLLGRPVLVVGGGAVATRRAKGLLDAGASVTVVAPEVSEELKQLHDAGLLLWRARSYRSADLSGSWFVQTATGNTEVDERVAIEAEEQRIWCVNATDHENSAAWTPSVARIDDVTVAVNAGGDPRRAVALRKAIASGLETGEIGTSAFKHHRPHQGSVSLVGGGPGAEDLITVRGRKLLAEADVVVADRLGPRGLLTELGEDTEIIEVGKSPHHHPVPQAEINQILVREARAGKRVVRLKGGDPYVLGRGGEEAEFCRQNDIQVEVVPGVTSAISVPAAAGIPVTHRGLARGFTVVSAHEDLEEVPPGGDHTVVLLMGVSTLRRSAVSLTTKGRGEDCPVAIIEDGFGAAQRITIGTLGGIADQAETIGVTSPAVIVVGDVVRISPFAPSDFRLTLPQPTAQTAR
ncbi:uroporphyrin-III C-methyltransferase/precorrin-2 dehydrogenase/sirohydrochlorin ferrochelatase [Psychromicrobium silvestre]|uniref:Uroporphyrin-III C-methyltransferase/precorrin-2 dehydrogenase/sirohydrochlorin ferrochelatase n=1 Tax=Psychromicrobium silvestre TaxID=1645614 RepID=A0A7Y9LTM6_9MICC|nr:uroporphyrinogen-III C-methyltransferase [Psychromicrobium silvestre]NYE95438.1 uroporphyrin-III C-methyltransferase/precorrin-2 dehydrogenase/sirohydrochlorin ferrochelatase [Psychromicrobium silvestre]